MSEKKSRDSSVFKYGKILEKGKPVHPKYDPFSIRHPHMELSRRAKIFAPFDALKGFHEAITEKDVLYEKRRELSEAETEKIDRILFRLKELTKNGRTARENQIQAAITCFIPLEAPDQPASDAYGTCKKISGTVFGIDEICRKIKINDIWISFDDILDIDCETEDTIS
ncbi:MAG: hypothetical protein IJ733_12435 [Lachnospiraceae bacterium]|nr:hypothetical protein [Lachnospiraceae bacterium]